MQTEYTLCLIFFLGGFIMGALLGFLNGINFIFKNKVYIRIILDLIFCFVLGFTLISLTNVYNMGIFRLYLCAFFAIGLWIEQKTLGKLFAKLFLKLYNYANKVVILFRQTRIGKILFK